MGFAGSCCCMGDKGISVSSTPKKVNWQDQQMSSVYGREMATPPGLWARVYDPTRCQRNYDPATYHSNYEMWKSALEEQRRYKRLERADKTMTAYNNELAGVPPGHADFPKSYEETHSSGGSKTNHSNHSPYHRTTAQFLSPMYERSVCSNQKLSTRQHLPYGIPIPRTVGDYRLLTSLEGRIVKAQYLGPLHYPPLEDTHSAIPSSQKMHHSQKSRAKSPITVKEYWESSGNDSPSRSSSSKLDKLILKSLLSSEDSEESEKPSTTSGINRHTPKRIRRYRSLNESTNSLDFAKADDSDSSSPHNKDLSQTDYNPFGVDESNIMEEGITSPRSKPLQINIEVPIGDRYTPEGKLVLHFV
jgi:hypothetical protein